jgi:succinyl-CoA synthetase alpha subunit
MAIIANGGTRLVVQGITGHQGRFHAQAMRAFGTEVVAGVTPGKGGQEVNGIPVYESVREATKDTYANTSVVFVPASSAKEAVMEAIDGGLKTVVVISERIPIHDSLDMIEYGKLNGARIIGPNCPGVSSPDVAKVGIMPNDIFLRGRTGVVSRSGTLTYEVVNNLTQAGIGQSTCVGIGGDPIVGCSFTEVLELFQSDHETERIVLIGEIGGTAEEEAAEFIRESMTKPVFAYIAGRTAPAGKRMGHAGAIIARGGGTAESKIRALERAGVPVAETPSQISELIKG